MVRKFWGGAGLVAAVVAGAGAASAADLAVKAAVYKAPPAVVSDWSGFYVGVNGGYGWGHTSVDTPAWLDYLCGVQAGSFNASPKGGVFGGQAGYNWQYGSVVTGLEVDFDGADIKASGNVGTFDRGRGVISQSTKVDELASVRARLGYTVLPNLLAYGTAGLGWGHSEVTESLTHNGSSTGDASSFGWVAGAGLEYKLFEHVLVRAEYLHYDLGKTTYGSDLSVNAATTVDVARGGISYKF